MKWLAMIVLVACSSSSHPVQPQDAGRDVGTIFECNCDPLTQSGCDLADDRCTWVAAGSEHRIGCAPAGSANVGEACRSGAPYTLPHGCGDALVADDCVRGALCVDGVCKRICNNLGGAPMCGSDEACVTVPGVFQYGSGNPFAAGVCEPACDPLADNDFLGSGVRGSACRAGSGCYGIPSGGTPPATQFACLPEGNAALVHRSVTASTAENACAEGYEPIVHDATGSTTIVCVALCSPADTYLGGPHAPLGNAPHRCSTTDARGTFAVHEHCMYLWRLEQDGSGNWLSSPSSNSVGVCIDHAQYRYDSNHDGMVDGSDAIWPDCQTLPLSGSAVVAADFGCVSTTTAPALPAAPAPGL